jgi:hypothetical protein
MQARRATPSQDFSDLEAMYAEFKEEKESKEAIISKSCLMGRERKSERS